MAAENGENAGTCARAEMREERRERAREEGAASWRTTRRTDMAVVGVTVTYIIRGPHDPTKAASAFAGWGSQNTERLTLTTAQIYIGTGWQHRKTITCTRTRITVRDKTRPRTRADIYVGKPDTNSRDERRPWSLDRQARDAEETHEVV